MKTVGHILMILIAVLLVIGATYALSQTTAVSALVGQPMGVGASEEQSAPAGFANGQNNPGGAINGRPEGGREGGLETLGQNLLKIAVIVMAVQMVWSIGQRMRRAAERTNRWQWGRSG